MNYFTTYIFSCVSKNDLLKFYVKVIKQSRVKVNSVTNLKQNRVKIITSKLLSSESVKIYDVMITCKKEVNCNELADSLNLVRTLVKFFLKNSAALCFLCIL